MCIYRFVYVVCLYLDIQKQRFISFTFIKGNVGWFRSGHDAHISNAMNIWSYSSVNIHFMQNCRQIFTISIIANSQVHRKPTHSSSPSNCEHSSIQKNRWALSATCLSRFSLLVSLFSEISSLKFFAWKQLV